MTAPLIIALADFAATHDGASRTTDELLEIAWETLGPDAVEAIGFKDRPVVFAVTHADGRLLAHEHAGRNDDQSKLSVLRQVLGSAGVTVAVSRPPAKPEVAGRVTLDVTLAPGETIVHSRRSTRPKTLG